MAISHLFKVRKEYFSLVFHLSPVLGEKWIFLTTFTIRTKCEIFSPTFTYEKGPISCLSWEKQIFHTLVRKYPFLHSLAGKQFFSSLRLERGIFFFSIFSINSLFGCARLEMHDFLHNFHAYKKALSCTRSKNTVCNTGRRAISDSGEVFFSFFYLKIKLFSSTLIAFLWNLVWPLQ